MSDNENDVILIADSLDESASPTPFRERGIGGGSTKAMVKAVNVNELKENVKHFFSQLNEILVTGGDKVGEFSVNQVEISAQITGEGKICLLGSGTKMSVNGGLKFILTRKN